MTHDEALAAAFNSHYVLVVGVGDSPGEKSHSDLFHRKLDELSAPANGGRVFWFTGGNLPVNGFETMNVLPEHIWVLFVKCGSPSGRDGLPVSEYCHEGSWHKVTGAVTGDGKSPKVIAMSDFRLVNLPIDLSQYSTFGNNGLVLVGTAGPQWVHKKPPIKSGSVKRLNRQLIAIGQLTSPYVAHARIEGTEGCICQ